MKTFLPNLTIFRNLTYKSIPDQQHCARFRKSQKSAKSLHPNRYSTRIWLCVTDDAIANLKKLLYHSTLITISLHPHLYLMTAWRILATSAWSEMVCNMGWLRSWCTCHNKKRKYCRFCSTVYPFPWREIFSQKGLTGSLRLYYTVDFCLIDVK